MGDPTSQLKARLRREVLAQRAALGPDELATAAVRLGSTLLADPVVAGARCVAAYVSVGREPSTRALLDRLTGRGVDVLVPVLLADGDLSWAAYVADLLEPATRGLLEPAGPRLGVDAVSAADVVLVPALAVDRSGHRLGRGGGSYDRALARRRPDTLVVALLHEGELLEGRHDVPVEPHDVGVDAVALPGRLTRLLGPA